MSTEMHRKRSSAVPNPADLYAHPLAYNRAIRGWSQPTFLTKLRETARENRKFALGTNRHTLSRWENGHQAPDKTTQLCIADLLDIPEDHVHRFPWPAWLPHGPMPLTTLEWTTAGAYTALREAAKASAADRRAFLVADGPTLTAAMAWWRIPAPYGPLGASTEGRPTVDFQAVATMSRRTDDLRLIFMDRGGGSLTSLVYEELRHLADQVDGSYEDAVGRQLFAVAADLAQLTGFSSAERVFA